MMRREKYFPAFFQGNCIDLNSQILNLVISFFCERGRNFRANSVNFIRIGMKLLFAQSAIYANKMILCFFTSS